MFSDESKAVTVVPSSISIGPPRVGKFQIESHPNGLYMVNTSTGELWVTHGGGKWVHWADGPLSKLAADGTPADKPGTKTETTVVKPKGE